MRALFALLLFVAAASCDARRTEAHGADRAATLSIDHAWAAPTPAGVDVSAGYFTIHNSSAAEDRLLSATSPRAARVEVHEMSMDGAVMRMRAVDRLAIGPGQDVELGPGGMHLMFYGVTAPFTEGETIPVRLTFEAAGAIDVSLPVRHAAPEGHAGH